MLALLPKRAIDLTGRVFGNMAVLRFSHKDKCLWWVCRCECGIEKPVKGRLLLEGKGMSCVCNGGIGDYSDITGMSFTFLRVLGKAPGHGWLCVCVCGKELTLERSDIKRKNASCGCRKGMANTVNISGKVFGRLTALYPWDESKHNPKGHSWVFLCDCGVVKIISKALVTQGQSSSCGCYKSEAVAARIVKFNKGRPPEQHYNWKGGVSKFSKVLRGLIEYKDWRTAVFERDDYTCQDCGKRGIKLHAHHIVHLSELLDLHTITTRDQARACPSLWDITNGVTVCVECHTGRHPELVPGFVGGL